MYTTNLFVEIYCVGFRRVFIRSSGGDLLCRSFDVYTTNIFVEIYCVEFRRVFIGLLVETYCVGLLTCIRQIYLLRFIV